ncbi:MAG: STAS domain-containing protein [Alphaproteobacteria bacterium]|nr:STAS domain-containing protein [Alphaproteobacteria bacterium]
MSEAIPVLGVGPVLLVSIQNELTDRSVSSLHRAVLERIQETGAPALLIDVTASEVIDTFIGRILSETARMAQLMNTDVVLVGMQPEVAITLLEMGLEIPNVRTAMSLEKGLEAVGYRITKIDDDANPSVADITESLGTGVGDAKD